MKKMAVLNAKIRPIAIALTAVLTVLAAQGGYADACATATGVPTAQVAAQTIVFND